MRCREWRIVRDVIVLRGMRNVEFLREVGVVCD